MELLEYDWESDCNQGLLTPDGSFMKSLPFEIPERVWMKGSPDLGERWLQTQIEGTPSMLGLGDVFVRDSQRRQPRAGVLDLLLEDSDETQRYEVEIQLGPTDESHIIRTIEYWDIERRRYPQYDHTAVIIAEDITSRFLNVIGLFNGSIPIMALQCQALKVGGSLTLVFTRVVDVLELGPVDDDGVPPSPADRADWERRGSKATVGMVDEILKLIQAVDRDVELKFNQGYIGLTKAGQPNNFVTFRPKRRFMILEVKMPQSEELDSRIADAGLETLTYSRRWGAYRIRLTHDDLKVSLELVRELAIQAYKRRNA